MQMMRLIPKPDFGKCEIEPDAETRRPGSLLQMRSLSSVSDRSETLTGSGRFQIGFFPYPASSSAMDNSIWWLLLDPIRREAAGAAAAVEAATSIV